MGRLIKRATIFEAGPSVAQISSPPPFDVHSSIRGRYAFMVVYRLAILDIT